MFRIAAACLAACVLLQTILPAARVEAQAADPFPVVPLETAPRRGHTWAYVSMIAGAGLVGGSFAFARRADDAYASYLASTDPVAIERFYDRTVHNDHLSQASLLTGEALIAAGLYLRFIRRPRESRVSWTAQPTRCWVAYHF